MYDNERLFFFYFYLTKLSLLNQNVVKKNFKIKLAKKRKENFKDFSFILSQKTNLNEEK